MKKLRLALLAGGKSGEREVSLKGAEEVARALNPQKYEIKRYDPATDLAKLASEADSLDVAFVLLHGPLGEDGTVQGFLDLLSLPYQGSGVLGSAIGPALFSAGKDLTGSYTEVAVLCAVVFAMLLFTALMLVPREPAPAAS